MKHMNTASRVEVFFRSRRNYKPANVPAIGKFKFY